jgi:hypothetical protein
MSQSTNATAAELRLLHDVAAGRDDQIVFQSVKGPIGQWPGYGGLAFAVGRGSQSAVQAQTRSDPSRTTRLGFEHR